jgi:TRAP-type C4-dicarboxylate transport system substrate-binding protein
MRKAIVFSICLGLVFGITIAHLPAGAQQVVTWKMQASYPVGTAVMMHGVEWAKEIEKRTNGRLKVEILPPGAICDVKDIINFMSKGVFDCAITYGGFYTGMIPETDLEIGLPQGHRTWEEVKDVMYKRGLGEVIQAAYDEHNIKWWPTAADCYYHFNTNFEVKKLDDLKGKKIRALGVYGKYVQLLGASPVVVPGAEMYMAMKLGTIDGAIYGATGLQDIKLYEVVKYYTLPTAAQIALSMCINKDSLKKLPADLRETVEKTMPEIMDLTSAKYIQMCKDSLNKSVEIKSTSICNLPDDEVAKMRKLVTPLWDELAAKSPRMKKGVDILKTQMKDLGRPMD